MKTIGKVGLIAGGILAVEVGSRIISRAIYKSKAKKAFKDPKSLIKKTDIYDTDSRFEDENPNMKNIVTKMIKEGKIVNLKSVVHADKEYDVVLFMDDFTSMKFTTEELILYKEPEKYTDEREVYKTLLGVHLVQLTRSGGAMSVVGINFSKMKSLNKLFIIVDTHLKKFISDEEINSLIHHEYYHCMKQNGMIESFLGINLNMLKVNLSGVGLDPVEELEADEFARINTGRSPQEFLGKLLEDYTSEVLGVSKLKCKFYKFNSWCLGR